MPHSEEFLRKLASEEVTGEFYPFETGDLRQVEQYIKKITGRLKSNPVIHVEPDFNYYGSGFASYVNVCISKQDNTDSRFTKEGKRITKWTKGLLLYISNLTPYWYYGGSEWTETTEDGVFKTSSSSFLSPGDIDNIDQQLWASDIGKFKLVMSDYGYRLLTRQEVEEPLSFTVSMASNLIDDPVKVFDCFFHWED